MAEHEKRYFDLKAGFNRVEVNTQTADETFALSGPTAVDEAESALIYELERAEGVKTVTQAEYDAARKAKADEERKQRQAKAERERKAAERKSTTSSKEAGQ